MNKSTKDQATTEFTKPCPNSQCGHRCYWMASICEVCGYDFIEEKLPKMKGKWPDSIILGRISKENEQPVATQNSKVRLYCQDALVALRNLSDNSLDSLVTDPPAGIGFMGKEWDGDKGGKAEWIAWLASILAEALRIMKPGAHGFVWALPRTSHLTANAIEDAGFEIRDRIAHLQAQGFPKSHNISKAIDKAAGAEREVIGDNPNHRKVPSLYEGGHHTGSEKITAAATDEARQWEGWGTALKPAFEDWFLIRKPISEKTIEANVLKWGVGGINIDACRVPITDKKGCPKVSTGGRETIYKENKEGLDASVGTCEANPHPNSRYPANFMHDGSPEVLAEFEKYGRSKSSKGIRRKPGRVIGNGMTHGKMVHKDPDRGCGGYEDEGTIARFFFCSKASRPEREAGCEQLPVKEAHEITGRKKGSKGLVMEGGKANPYAGTSGKKPKHNHHPTVKPLALMRYLCRLVTPSGGTVLDCFMGSGSTGVAALQEGFSFIGIEQEPEYFTRAEARIKAANNEIEQSTVPQTSTKRQVVNDKPENIIAENASCDGMQEGINELSEVEPCPHCHQNVSIYCGVFCPKCNKDMTKCGPTVAPKHAGGLLRLHENGDELSYYVPA